MAIIVKKTWNSGKTIFRQDKYFNEGWFLFGIIPLYISRTEL